MLRLLAVPAAADVRPLADRDVWDLAARVIDPDGRRRIAATF